MGKDHVEAYREALLVPEQQAVAQSGGILGRNLIVAVTVGVNIPL